MEEGINPIYDKEMRSEIFSQGTLMLRLVIQISMGLALFVMAGCLYIRPALAAWYISYVLLFNMLVGPVFSAGSVTSERERQTLDLLLVTLVTPWQMLWGKLLSGLRVSSVLTSFLLWPVLLACLMPLPFWHHLPTMVGYVLVVAFDVRDYGRDGAVLLDGVSENGDEPDCDVSHHRGDVHGAGGNEVFCGDVLARHVAGGSGGEGGSIESVFRRILIAAEYCRG